MRDYAAKQEIYQRNNRSDVEVAMAFINPLVTVYTHAGTYTYINLNNLTTKEMRSFTKQSMRGYKLPKLSKFPI
jgi:hypothetical protein